jgi:hypothetical protein
MAEHVAALSESGIRVLDEDGVGSSGCGCCEEGCCFVPPPEVEVATEVDPMVPTGAYTWDSQFTLPAGFVGSGTAHKYVGTAGDAIGTTLILVRRCGESLVAPIACCSTLAQVAEFRWYVAYEDECDPETCEEPSGTFYHPVDAVEMFFCMGYVFDGSNPQFSWTNDYSTEWAEEASPGCLPEPVRQAWYDTCEGSGGGGGGAEPFIIPVSLTAGLYHGTIDGTTACWQIFDSPPAEPTRCVPVGGDLTPIESCDDPFCGTECEPDEEGNFRYTLAYCVDPETPVAEIVTDAVYEIGTVLVDAVDAPPPRFLVIACASAEGADPGPPYEDYLMNPIFPNGILDTEDGCP